MTKQEIDTKFTSIIPMMETIVKGVAYKYHKKIDVHAAISEAYIYVIERSDLCTTPDMMQRIAIQFLNKSIIWSTSKLNKLEKVNNNNEFIPEDSAIDDSDIDEKIELELWYTQKKCTLEMYKEQETDKVKLIIFDLYYNRGITKGIDLAKHLGINKDYACKYIREMKQTIRNYEKQNETRD